MSADLVQARPLPPVAAKVDVELARLDEQIDWLLALSPIHNDALWDAFNASGRRSLPPLRYVDLDIDLHATRERLLALPVEDIESSLLAALLGEKQREIDRQIELVRLRGTEGFVSASLDLFGGVDSDLLAAANEILDEVAVSEPASHDAGIDEVLEAVELEVRHYQAQAPDFKVQVVVDADLNSLMMVSHGRLYLNAGLRLPAARVQPLVQHEVGTHVVTRHNGRHQALLQLEVGLAHYDALQEGLGVLAEYLAGYLPGERLRVLAARVVAVEMAMQGEGVPAIFDLLHHTHSLSEEDAFDVAVRALRGGGLSKDAVYLRGLRDLHEHLRQGGDFESLFIGKFALSQLRVLDQLAGHGWVVPPQLLPRYLEAPEARARLDACRTLPLKRIFDQELPA
jgi:uncharacterized protein (TIGR02421 family)